MITFFNRLATPITKLIQRNFWIVTFLLFFSGSIQITFAQNDLLNFKHLNRNQGLASNSLTSIYEDVDGFMWFGTDDGLSRFDGYDFVTFRHDNNDSTSLSSSKITCIVGDAKHDNFWIGTQDGLNYYDKEKQQITRYPLPNSSFVTHLSFWGENDDLIISTLYGIYMFSRLDGTISLLDESLAEFAVQCTYAVTNESLFIGTANHGLYEYSSSGNLKQIVTESDILTDIRFIHKDSLNDIWVGSDLGLVELDGTNYSIKHTYDATNTSFTSSRIHGMIEVSKGEFYIIERDGGLYSFKKDVGPINFYTHDKYSETSIISKAITAVFYSSPKILWVGTYNGGISYVDFNAKSFRHFKSNFKPDGIFNNNIRSMMQDSQGNIWIGTKEEGGISKFNAHSGTFMNIAYEKGNNSTPGDDYVLALEEYNERYLLLGTLKDGLNVFDRQENIFSSYNEADIGTGTLSNIRVYSIKTDPDGTVWVGTIKSLQLFDFETRTFTRIPGIKNVRDIHIVNDDIIWFAARGTGLVIYSKTEGILQTLTHDKDNPESIPHDHISQILQAKNSNYWFATDYGIAEYTKDLKFIRHYTKSEGLPSDKICGIQEDDNGNIWLSTNNGIARLDTQNDKVKVYDINDGLQDNEFEYYSSIKTSDGEIIFGGRNGFNIFNPADIKDNAFIPPVKVTDLKVFNQSVKAGGANSPLEKSIMQTKELNLKYNQNSISFDFVALNYTSVDKIQYEYKLIGFDDTWIKTKTFRTASYTNLPHGHYTFIVKASNNDGVWNKTPTSIEIYIKPPFWKTWLFRILIVLLIISATYKFYMNRMKEMHSRQKILENKIKEGEKIVADKVQEVEKQKEEIRLRDEREQEMRYSNQGLAKFSGIISTKNDSLELLCQALITGIMEYADCIQGLIYVLVEDGYQEPYLEIKGEYGVDKERVEHRTVKIGEGYVGTCFKEETILELKDLPESFPKINSGLGELTPNHVLFIPIKQNNTINGVLEIASFNTIEKYKIDFLSNLGETISSAINTFLSNHKVEMALTKSNQQKEELLAQEEELRQNLEEMQATKEEIQRQVDNNKSLSSDLLIKTSILDTLMNQTSEFIYIKDTQGRITEIGKKIHPLFPSVKTKDLIGKYEVDFLSNNTKVETTHIEEEIIKTGNSVINKSQNIVNNKGDEFIVNISRFPLVNDNKEVIGIIGIIRELHKD